MSKLQNPVDLAPWLEKLRAATKESPALLILVDTATQQLLVMDGETVCQQFPVSTALKGTGCCSGSFQTPTGLHRIDKKIGDEQPIGMIFKGRMATGDICSIEDNDQDTGADLITTRILWLSGLESGINQGGDVDSRDRYIYIHGTNEERRIGRPVSHGCIRMTNADVITLFDLVKEGTPVLIV